jgi:hypothetical protein
MCRLGFVNRKVLFKTDQSIIKAEHHGQGREFKPLPQGERLNALFLFKVATLG